MDTSAQTNRRNVLKLLGAGAVGSVLFSGPASAEHRFGNGNGIGAFLNEKAQFKDHPVWKDGVADRTGRGTVEVEVGTMTSINPPFPVPPELAVGPFGFGPRAVKVSPGTTVRWVWTGNPWDLVDPNNPWGHDVASLEKSGGTHKFISPFQGTGEYEFTFEEVGTNLYFCHPHGYPFHDGEHDYNLVGMRGAVLVTDD